jgi:hypothetical protein
MRGLALGLIFFSLLPLVFVRGKIFGFLTTGPFLGVLMYYWISLMVPEYLVWGGFFGGPPLRRFCPGWSLANRNCRRPTGSPFSYFFG